MSDCVGLSSSSTLSLKDGLSSTHSELDHPSASPSLLFHVLSTLRYISFSWIIVKEEKARRLRAVNRSGSGIRDFNCLRNLDPESLHVDYTEFSSLVRSALLTSVLLCFSFCFHLLSFRYPCGWLCVNQFNCNWTLCAVLNNVRTYVPSISGGPMSTAAGVISRQGVLPASQKKSGGEFL